jgi:polar amino acid transport system ATP-binding protein
LNALNALPIDVEITDLTKRFGDRHILRGVSLKVKAGETVALIGPSGGGKSTLLRCINGLQTFDGGEIRVGTHRLLPQNGNVLHTQAAREARRLFGMIFQDFQLFPHLTALQNVMEGPVLVLGTPKEQAQAHGLKLLESVGLADRANDYPRQLSGGQKQRVAIARALAMQPRGLLCDEITSALDPELKQDVLDVLVRLKGEGMTLLMVTHEIGFARRAADRVVLLAEGRIIEDGPPADVLDRPQSERARQFLQCVMG